METSVQSEDLLMKGQADIWKLMFAFADSMALKSAVELGVADIIAAAPGGQLTLSGLVSRIDSPTTSDPTCLRRIMRLLVRKGVFSADGDTDAAGDTVYGLTASSRWLLRGGTQPSLAPFILMENHPDAMAPWHCLSRCVREAGGVAFKMAHHREIWEFSAENPEFNKMFQEGLGCTSKILVGAVVKGYQEGFGSLRSLVDVGGGNGASISEIVKVYPYIKGINFDLHHVVATAPLHEGVVHVGGDMFESIPDADAVFIKWVLHDWSDEDCVRILQKCKKAVPKKTGKVIIVEVVLKPDGEGLFDETGVVLDLLMIAHASGGKERTEPEWKKILEEGGFPRYNIIKLPTLISIIEAFPYYN